MVNLRLKIRACVIPKFKHQTSSQAKSTKRFTMTWKSFFSYASFVSFHFIFVPLLVCLSVFLSVCLFVCESRDGAVVEHLLPTQASHQCGPGSILGLGVICGLSLLLVLVSAPRVFLRVLRFSSLHKNQHFQIPIRSGLLSSTLSRATGSGDCASTPACY